MNYTQTLNLSQLFRPIQIFMIAAVCSLVMFSNAVPAFAISSDRSSPTQGEVQLDDIYEKSEDALRKKMPNMQEVQEESAKGFNEIQGDADLDKMSRPDNSRQATTAKEQAERALKKATNTR